VQFNSLTLTLQNFIAALSGGYGRLQGPAHSLLAVMVGIEIVLLGFWTALGGGDNVVGAFKKILHIGGWVWFVGAFQSLSKAFVTSLINAGFMAGGGGGDVSLLMDPSRIAGYGLDATEPLTKKVADLGMTDLSDLFMYAFGYLAILACFLVMAINVFLAVLEYYLFVALVGILLPFGLLAPTKFLAEKAIGAVVAAGVKLMTLAFLLSIIEPVLATIHFAGPEITLNELWSVLLTVCSLMLLCWKAPSLAANLLSGSPNLGHGDALQAGQTAVLAGAAVAHAAMGNGAAAGRAATQAASSAHQGTKSGASASASSLGAVAGVAGGGGGGGGGGGPSGGGSSPTGGAPAGGSPSGGGGSPGAAPGGASAPASPGASPSLVMSSMGKSGADSPPGGSSSSSGGASQASSGGAPSRARAATSSRRDTTIGDASTSGTRGAPSPAASSSAPAASSSRPPPPAAA
jgi:type IV secretion system protein TrbL